MSGLDHGLHLSYMSYDPDLFWNLLLELFA